MISSLALVLDASKWAFSMVVGPLGSQELDGGVVLKFRKHRKSLEMVSDLSRPFFFLFPFPLFSCYGSGEFY